MYWHFEPAREVVVGKEGRRQYFWRRVGI